MYRVSEKTAHAKREAKDSKPQIVLDYDGVIMRSNKASSIIANKCDAFVGHITRNKSVQHARSLNQSLFKTHGHTALGLRTLGYNVPIREFNKFVYGDLDYVALGLDESDFDLEGLAEISREHKGRVHIYSNAPDSWVTDTMSFTEAGKKLLDGVQILSMHEYDHMKPEPVAFEYAAKKLGTENVYFVDDMLLNIQIASMVGGWHGVWYNPALVPFRISDDLVCIHNFKEMLYYIALKESQKDIRKSCA